MDVYDYRRINLQAIIRDEHGGSIVEMVENATRQPEIKITWSHSLISQWAGLKTKKHKQIGNKAARTIEKIYQKPSGWMDLSHEIKESALDSQVETDPGINTEAAQLAINYKLLPRNLQRNLQDIMKSCLEIANIPIEPKKRPSRVYASTAPAKPKRKEIVSK